MNTILSPIQMIPILQNCYSDRTTADAVLSDI